MGLTNTLIYIFVFAVYVISNSKSKLTISFQLNVGMTWISPFDKIFSLIIPIVLPSSVSLPHLDAGKFSPAMANDNPNSTLQQMLGSMFIGTAISFM